MGINTVEQKKERISRQSLNQIGRLFAFVRPYRFRLYAGIVTIIIGSLLGLAGPYTLQFLIDAVFKNNNARLLNQITVILIGIFLLQSVFYFLRAYLLSFIGERVMADLRIPAFQPPPIPVAQLLQRAPHR